MRTQPQTKQPPTPSQRAARTRMGYITQLWKQLTEIQRSKWEDITPSYRVSDYFTINRKLSGFNLFRKLNSNLLEAGMSLLDEPQPPMQLSNFLISRFHINPDGSNADYEIDIVYIAPDSSIVAYSTPPLSPGIRSYNGMFHSIFSIPYYQQLTPRELAQSLSLRWGPLTVGQRFMVEATSVGHTGQKTFKQRFETKILDI